ncbi:MAG: gliding motility lipoprotein GldH [Bacteroidales bacterium]|jgi:gliding motility-associated lipoprotein GldH|nr:gliding motility lipoprotein GldH [Bacteroidales bacterium]
MKHTLFFSFFVLFLLLFSACSRRDFYEKNDTIPNEIWNMDSALTYQFKITDSLQYYDIYINVRNSVDFETQNFYIFLTTIFPSGYIGKDTLGCILCDNYGVWKGKSSGRLKDNRFLFKSKVRFNQKGLYTLKVYQAMRTENLKGIANFGISLCYHEQNKQGKQK